MKLINVIGLLFFIMWASCLRPNVNTTPIKYKNNTKVSFDRYTSHLRILKDSLTSIISDNRLAYYPTDNDSNTTIIIDTIVYSPQQNKIAFLVITKKPVGDRANKSDKHQFHYDGNAFVADLKNDSILNNIQWISATTLSNYPDFRGTSSGLRLAFLRNFNQRQDIDGHSLYKYNLDDVRFWTGPIWKQ